MNKQISVTVAVATYNRPEGLKKLLNGLSSIDIPENTVISIVVLDNSQDANAKKIVLGAITDYPLSLSYFHVPEKGITFPRNKGLQFALENNADYLAYIDDDEVPCKQWMYYLLNEIKDTGAAVISGVVKPIFNSTPLWWMQKGGFFAVQDYPVRVAINYAHTGNVLIDTQVIRDLQLKFDPDFALSGGEDTLFFKTIRNAGYLTMFSKEAIVYEDIVDERARFKWLIIRWFRTGNTDGLIATRENGSAIQRFTVVSGGLGRIMYGLLCGLFKLPLLLVKNPAFFECLRVLMRGIGFVASVSGFMYQEYKNHKR